ncbi:MAG: FtsW/RodA/SpoVE family cell cycle protein, partial [Lachnospiraceae bacterium]|nr:FtsW/RodA/SpoVE family cell cycle protein [Lachnospiraceae bacterium]
LGFVIQMFWISTWMDSLFYKIVGFGLAVMIGAQTILHIGGITAMIPMTGITLPLISYGGSSLIGTMIIIGIIQGLHLMKQKEVDYIGRRAEELFEETPPLRGSGSGRRK